MNPSDNDGWGLYPHQLHKLADAKLSDIRYHWYTNAYGINLAVKLLDIGMLLGDRVEHELPTPHSRPAWHYPIVHVDLWVFNGDGLFNSKKDTFDEVYSLLVVLRKTLDEQSFEALPWWERPALFRWRVVNGVMLKYFDGDRFVIVPGLWVKEALKVHALAQKEAEKRSRERQAKADAALRTELLAGMRI